MDSYLQPDGATLSVGDMPSDAADIAELRAALLSKPPQIPSKYFYDTQGSVLFEQITETPEYYPTRTEIGLLERHAAAMLAELQPVEIAELGSGSGRKTELLVEAGRAAGSLRRLSLLDIADEFLHESANRMAARWPDLEIHPVVGDFTADLDHLGDAPGRRLLVFLAGTIGNLNAAAVDTFLRAASALLVAGGADDGDNGDALLLGVDLVKPEPRLVAAYDDAAGVTAAFNLNILDVVNGRFGGDFEVDAFAHAARWNADERRIEMWLEATRPTTVRIEAADVALSFDVGDGVRTELSCKYTRDLLERRLQRAGLQLDRWMVDDEGLFALALVRKALPPLARLQRAWARSDALFALLADNAWQTRAIPLRHPPIFYLGHLPAFAWNQIGRGALGEAALDDAFEQLFERGIDPLDADAAAHHSRANWPSLAEIYAYRDRVRAAIVGLGDRLHALASTSGDLLLARGRVLHLVAEHELMHHETLLYLLHALPTADLVQPPLFAGRPLAAPVCARHDGTGSARVAIAAGPARLGTNWDDVAFAWDIELDATEVDVAAFELDARAVTQAEFAAFIADGGYSRSDLWDDGDLAWCRSAAASRDPAKSAELLPDGWRGAPEADGDYEIRWLFGWLPLAQVGAWPARVSCAEAVAFARWRGGRLPTEAELLRARAVAAADSAYYDEGTAFQHFAPLPVRDVGSRRIDSLVGNGWEWTSTDLAPLPGYRAWARNYPGYSADFFDGAHAVVVGASWATDRSMLRPGFRNWYQRRYSYVFSKFRIAWSA